jgi:hypothetical protein
LLIILINCLTKDSLKRREILLYQEYQSVCPFVRIGSSCPLSRKRVCPQLETKGGGQHSLLGEGAGGANSDERGESLALFILWSQDNTSTGMQ